MVLEIAVLHIHTRSSVEFEAATEQALPLFLRAKGCLGVQFMRCLGEPDDYRLLVNWDVLENHTVNFRGSEDFQAWRALVAPFFSAPPQVIHCSDFLRKQSDYQKI